MALLKIAEPGQGRTRQAARRKRAVGIDLGTTNSLVATAEAGKARVLELDGARLLPSIVHYHKTGFSVGGATPHAEAMSVSSVKRLMGRGREDVSHQLPYKLEDSTTSGMPRIVTPSGHVSPVQVSAEILGVLAKHGAQVLGGDLDGVVITVPAYFDEAQREATRDAARLAGLNVLRLLSEPTAAAVAYGLDKKLQGTIIIYDLGGGTFDVSLMKLQRGVFEVIATGGDTSLGGDDFDRAIAQWILQQGNLQTPQGRDWAELLARSKAAKHKLTEQAETTVECQDWQGVLDRETLHSLIRPLILKTLKSCSRVLRDGDITSDELTDVVLVGGSTRTWGVRESVRDFFGREPLCSLDPDEVVAIGAALQADVLVGNKYGEETLLLDVIPLSLGIETMGGLMEKIIPRNTTIPVARAQEFTTFRDGQTVMALHVLQGERELVPDCRSLARFELKNIPAMVAGAARIRVTFQVDADGLLEVKAEEMVTGVHSSVVVKPSFGLLDSDIEKMLVEARSAVESDVKTRTLREKQVEAERHIEALNAALAADADTLLDEAEKTALQEAMNTLAEAAGGNDGDLIERLTHQLNQVSQEFAARRMDAGIRKALAGHAIDELD